MFGLTHKKTKVDDLYALGQSWPDFDSLVIETLTSFLADVAVKLLNGEKKN